MLNRLLLLALFMALSAGCATYRDDTSVRMATLPMQYDQFDIKLAWDITATGDSTVINGVVKNIRYYEMDELEIRVVPLDSKGREGAGAVDFIYRLRENEAAAFMLAIPRVMSGSTLRFFYRYVGSDGGGNDGGDAGSWRQSFEVVAP